MSYDLQEREITSYLDFKFSTQQLLTHKMLPIEENTQSISMVFDPNTHIEAKSLVYMLYPTKSIVEVKIPQIELERILTKMHRNHRLKEIIKSIRQDLQNITEEIGINSAPSILQLIDFILAEAISYRASDIHIEASTDHCIIRQRIDGKLQEHFSFDKDVFYPLSSRLKLLASLDIAQSRLPQDGRFSTTIENISFDLRVSTLPTIHGESIVVRILENQPDTISLEDLGISQFTYASLQKALQTPYGMVLVTGPTGAGKTTTLYAILQQLNHTQHKVITIEDPVEYKIEGLQQVQIDEQIGISFHTILKSILRQDPDTIMIGEIRDTQTLRMAIQSALTGHKVLSTLHTNSAILAIQRMRDMGIESYFLSGAITAIMAQRLLRLLCRECKQKRSYSDTTLKRMLGYIPTQKEFYDAVGCETCHYTGYSGREMMSEVLRLTPAISALIRDNASQEALLKQAKIEGYIPMLEDGLQKVMAGKSTLEELLTLVS